MSTTSDTEQSTSEQMAADAAKKPRKPRNSPDLWPFQQLPRRRRGEFMRCLGRVMAAQEAQADTSESAGDAPEPDAPADDAQFQQLGQMYDLMADLEDTLRVAAKDLDAFNEWAASCTDEQLMQLSGWYTDRFQVGEAPASSA